MLFNFICKRILIHAKPYIKLEHRYHGLLSSSSFQSSLFTTTTSNLLNQHSFTVNYLINSCGVSPESAIIAAKHIDLQKSPNKADSVIAFFNDQGFTKSQVSYVISRHPKILVSNPEKTILPYFKVLNSIGLSGNDITEIVTARPKSILQKRLEVTALPTFNYLKSILLSDDLVFNAIKRYPLTLTYDIHVYAAENIRFLRKLGVPKSNLVTMLAQQPRTFFTSIDRFKKVVNNVTEMGFDPTKTRFLWAIHAIRAMSKSTWDTKMEIYKKYGWSEEEIVIAFEKYPGCMMASSDKITRTLDFLVNTMGWEKSYIVKWSIVICFSFEKRVIPRCLVYQYLEEKGLTEKDDFCFTKWMMYPETKFLKWVVTKYEEEGPQVVKLYKKYLGEAETNGSVSSAIQKREVV